MSGSLGDFKETLIKTASENENLAGVTYGAAVAVGGLALAAGAAALTLRGMGGGKVPDLPTGTRGGLASKATNAAKQQVLLVLLTLALSYLKPIDDAGYKTVSDPLAKIGIGSGGDRPDFVQQAIEQSKAQQASAEEKSSQLIAEQQKQNQLSQEMINRINALINVTGQNKPMVFNGGGSLLDAISHNAATQEEDMVLRHSIFRKISGSVSALYQGQTFHRIASQ